MGIIEKYISKLRRRPTEGLHIISEIDAEYRKTHEANNNLLNDLSPSVQLMIEITDRQGYNSWAFTENKLGITTPNPTYESTIYGIVVGCIPKEGSKNYNNNDHSSRIGKPVVCMFKEPLLSIEQMAKALVLGWIGESLKHNKPHRVLKPMAKSKFHSINKYKIINLKK